SRTWRQMSDVLVPAWRGRVKRSRQTIGEEGLLSCGWFYYARGAKSRNREFQGRTPNSEVQEFGVRPWNSWNAPHSVPLNLFLHVELERFGITSPINLEGVFFEP